MISGMQLRTVPAQSLICASLFTGVIFLEVQQREWVQRASVRIDNEWKMGLSIMHKVKTNEYFIHGIHIWLT